MAQYAFEDEKRNKVIYATNAKIEDRNKIFYCPNPHCTAQLYVCAIDGSMTAYFRATKPDFKHSQGCSYSSCKEFNPSEYDEKIFNFDDAIEKLLSISDSQKMSNNNDYNHGTGASKIKSLRTLSQIYTMCKNLPVKDTYGSKEISVMLLDDRSLYRYLKGCFGTRIIESHANKRLYDNEKKEIYLSAPIMNKKYSFILKFNNDKIYKDMKEMIYNNRDNVIIVVGKWKSSGIYNCFITDIYTTKQIAINKNVI